jgi:hypothetical protein
VHLQAVDEAIQTTHAKQFDIARQLYVACMLGHASSCIAGPAQAALFCCCHAFEMVRHCNCVLQVRYMLPLSVSVCGCNTLGLSALLSCHQEGEVVLGVLGCPNLPQGTVGDDDGGSGT